ncbi:hypothetical protein BZG36_02211 [Bifiguratus adelaidae]|uniref:BHLH domain-containing protein n=1 Tax=Bifiguratus adelaidae TaxID=1938954 RepID=A0A261Y3F8_9FUNG|nr:hypothetical protein BZG36_02211 [Bifiguratus adelaidae]
MYQQYALPPSPSQTPPLGSTAPHPILSFSQLPPPVLAYPTSPPSPVEKTTRQQAHSVIERKRRQKMNQKIACLHELVPSLRHVRSTCKLSVLKAVVEYIEELQAMARQREGDKVGSVVGRGLEWRNRVSEVRKVETKSGMWWRAELKQRERPDTQDKHAHHGVVTTTEATSSPNLQSHQSTPFTSPSVSPYFQASSSQLSPDYTTLDQEATSGLLMLSQSRG